MSPGDNNKSASPFDNKWKPADKRKTVDDSYAGAPVPRLVPLRGSDFTGLGIEVCGGLKDGIYIKKVMPQGPAFGIVNRGKYWKTTHRFFLESIYYLAVQRAFKKVYTI